MKTELNIWPRNRCYFLANQWRFHLKRGRTVSICSWVEHFCVVWGTFRRPPHLLSLSLPNHLRTRWRQVLTNNIKQLGLSKPLFGWQPLKHLKLAETDVSGSSRPTAFKANGINHNHPIVVQNPSKIMPNWVDDHLKIDEFIAIVPGSVWDSQACWKEAHADSCVGMFGGTRNPYRYPLFQQQTEMENEVADVNSIHWI